MTQAVHLDDSQLISEVAKKPASSFKAAKTGFEGKEEAVGKAVQLALKTMANSAGYQHEMNDALVKARLQAIQFAKDMGIMDKYVEHDIKTMALLGKYYAYKIAGATQLAMYRETRDKKYQDLAIAQLEQAMEAWKNYTSAAMEQNINPLWTNRVGYVDWLKITDWVADDIEIAKAG